MTRGDIPLGMGLKEQAGWNQTDADWHRLFGLQPDGCFVAELDGAAVGTVTTCLFERVGWIGMLLVDQRARHRGVGTALFMHAMDCLAGHGAATMQLDATPLGLRLYEKHGFVVQSNVTRFGGEPGCMVAHGDGLDLRLAPLQNELGVPGARDELFALDRSVLGYDRRQLLIALLGEPSGLGWMYRDAGRLAGYVLVRPGSLAAFVGPCIADSDMAGDALLKAALAHSPVKRVFVDVVGRHGRARDVLQSAGLCPVRELMRMVRGPVVGVRNESLWASSGPETG
jgi:GNAT superfamily N-acetyltransferase